MNQAVAEHVKTCDICQRIKPPGQYNNPELQPIITSQPLEKEEEIVEIKEENIENN
jgi:epoxyqueuosine reductase QueG